MFYIILDTFICQQCHKKGTIIKVSDKLIMSFDGILTKNGFLKKHHEKIQTG